MRARRLRFRDKGIDIIAFRGETWYNEKAEKLSNFSALHAQLIALCSF
jgi:hypothetical protein